MTEAYPLAWPQGWPRHKGQQDSDTRFKGPRFQWDRVYRGLTDELKRIGATKIVVSTNQPLRNDGAPYAQQRNISDVGVAASRSSHQRRCYGPVPRCRQIGARHRR